MVKQYDPYDNCPCGSGKKIKWCCQEFIPDLDKVQQCIRDNQLESALRQLDELAAKKVNPHFVAALRAQALMAFQRVEDAFNAIEKTIIEFPESAVARETRANMLVIQEDHAEALDAFTDALAHCAAEAKPMIVRILFKIGNCHFQQGRPVAAWAHWQRSLKIDPTFEHSNKALNQAVKENRMLPNSIRHGLRLKSPDELELFNEQREEKWALATNAERDWHLDELVSAFEELAKDEEYDVAAWYNLAVAAAWNGENAKAIDALEHYIGIEPDFETAADAAELGEVLRLGVGAEEYSDVIHYVCSYDVTDFKAFVDTLRNSKQVAIITNENENMSMHWMDREMLAESEPGVTLVGGAPRQIAQIAISENSLELVSSSQSNLETAQKQFEALIGDTVSAIGHYQRPGSLETLDAEPFLVMHQAHHDDEQRDEATLKSIQQYFEHDWIDRPMRALDGLSPVDAAQSPKYKKRLEGIVRFRERSFHRYDFAYDFDRLRNKLGLETSGNETATDDISAYSAEQLAGLNESELEDVDLIVAYKAASSLAADQSALRFAQEILRRNSLREEIDFANLFKRIISIAVEAADYKTALSWIEKGIAHDTQFDEEANRSRYEAYRAQIHLANNNIDDALTAYEDVFNRDPDNVELMADAVERLLSSGQYARALEIAERGSQRAEALKMPELQEQFREYTADAKTRV